MIERYMDKVEILCDGCGDGTGSYPSEDFDVMVREAKDKGWRNVKVEGEWQNYCPDCK